MRGMAQTLSLRLLRHQRQLFTEKNFSMSDFLEINPIVVEMDRVLGDYGIECRAAINQMRIAARRLSDPEALGVLTAFTNQRLDKADAEYDATKTIVSLVLDNAKFAFLKGHWQPEKISGDDETRDLFLAIKASVDEAEEVDVEVVAKAAEESSSNGVSSKARV